ncbi:TAG lipase / steryl ester hydrolase / phospholipase A2 / LPA acyltransferase [Geosmithia morbida]|uniref:Patatin-like phospholipase domain-containing protein n=1 Tax=Geosmithia morbida TaxID=1094350 RepID=A0A9P5CYH2_9HYPO|nr:TAG lipase / steryl ester hydrolase / phospholipase A2 / LPA acyltransferase [Geosmithia morbida]KAF4120423.1 TAG lipase / steryl ester hydrolase / phospholipase A2 / LPA acyltransferase [Geosmithia morbida]
MADLLISALPAHLDGYLPSSTGRSQVRPLGLKGSKSTPHLCKASAKDGALSRTFKGVGSLWFGWRDGLTWQQRKERDEREQRNQILCLRMKTAESYAQWEAAAAELDRLQGNDKWKEDESAMVEGYNAVLLAERLRQLDDARYSCDLPSMMHLIRTALSRDLAGMDNVDLYRHSYMGTKVLIERYVESTLATIDAVVTQSSVDTSVELRDLLEGMLFARQSFGRSALLLSGGGTFGMAHIGVVKSLFEARLFPRIISGASAGSIVCAVVCTRVDEEIPGVLKAFPHGNLAVFEEEDNRDGILGHIRRLLTEGSWSDIQHLSGVMRELTGDLTFQEAYNRTRRILNICVSSASIYELPRLLNYVTAPNVMIWSAVAASCSVPIIFNAPPLLVKDPLTGEHLPWNPTPQRWIDGSVDNDLPMTRLAEMFNVNHFIVSQVNPHVIPFLANDDYIVPDRTPVAEKRQHNDNMDLAYTLTSLARDEALHRLQFLAEVGIFPNMVDKIRSVLSQKYSGDITILPEMSMQDLPGILTNPTVEFITRSTLLGERATWPKLSRIRDRCAIELALDRAVHCLRARVVFEEGTSDNGNTNHNYMPNNHHSSVSNVHLHGRASSDFFQVKNQKKNDSFVPPWRRLSGGSLSSAAHRKTLLDDDGITPSDTLSISLVHNDPPSLLSTPILHPSQEISSLSRTPTLKRVKSSYGPVPKH